jgi:hypothetical protein
MRCSLWVRRWVAGGALLAALGALGCADPLVPGPPYPLVLEANQVELSGPQRLAYEEDAVRLAIRRLVETSSPAASDVIPPQALVMSLYHALVHVHGASHPVRDSVVDLYRVRTFPDPATREIMVRVNPAYEWAAAWKELNARTGYAAIDSLVDEYDLSVREYYRWSIGDVAVLRAGQPLNAAALATRFAPIPGVIWAERNGAGGDGNDIRARPWGDGWRLDYSVGFGDCPAGCIHRHTWSFGVGKTGVVTFLGRSGPPPPKPPYT